MTNSQLSGPTLLRVHRDILIDNPAAVDDFGSRCLRRLQMVDMLSEDI